MFLRNKWAPTPSVLAEGSPGPGESGNSLRDFVPGRPVVEVSGVNKVYSNGTVALKDVDLTVREGEFVSLLGPSGCGKSTLLRMIAGLGQPNFGSLRWWEQGFDVVGDRSRKLAYVFQEPTLMPWTTVAGNVRLPLDLAGAKGKETEQRVRAALELVGLEKFTEAYPRQLSGGMQMRASIARALVTNPNVLLMDEPFGALDEITRGKLNADLLALWKAKGWTIVFVTHSVYEAVYLSSRIVVMAARPGRVLSEFEIDEPYPRQPAFRTSQRYGEYCARLSEALENASSASGDSLEDSPS